MLNNGIGFNGLRSLNPCLLYREHVLSSISKRRLSSNPNVTGEFSQDILTALGVVPKDINRGGKTLFVKQFATPFLWQLINDVYDIMELEYDRKFRGHTKFDEHLSFADFSAFVMDIITMEIHLSIGRVKYSQYKDFAPLLFYPAIFVFITAFIGKQCYISQHKLTIKFDYFDFYGVNFNEIPIVSSDRFDRLKEIGDIINSHFAEGDSALPMVNGLLGVNNVLRESVT
jgi:hypothetical protein